MDISNKRICKGCSLIYIRTPEMFGKQNYCSEKCKPKKLTKEDQEEIAKEMCLKLMDFGFSKKQVEDYKNGCWLRYFIKSDIGYHKRNLFCSSNKDIKLKFLREKKIEQYELDLIYK